MIQSIFPSRAMALLITVFMIVVRVLVVSSQTYSGTFHHPKLIENSSPLHDSANGIVHHAYIIRLSDTVRDVKSIMTQLLGASINDGGNYTHVFQHVFKGFSVGGMSNPRMSQLLDSKIVHSAERVRSILLITSDSFLSVHLKIL
jgi:hypothetical protein